MSDVRKATVKQRMYPHTFRRLQTYARERDVDCAQALEELVPHKRLMDGYGVCRYCEVHMKNPRGAHAGHEAGCVLFAGGVKADG